MKGSASRAPGGSHLSNLAVARRIRAHRLPGRGRPRRAGVLATALAGLALLAAACGGSPAPAGSSGSLPAGPPRYQQALAYSQCMRSHGIANFPDPNSEGNFAIKGNPSNGIDESSPQYLSANKTCQKLLGSGGPLTPAQQQQQMSAALRLARCIRSHGITNFPDPTRSGSNGVSFTLNGTGISPGRAQPVIQTCQKLTHFAQGTP